MKDSAHVDQHPNTTEILHARALVLARQLQRLDDAKATIEVLEFTLASEHYAIETRHVLEVVPLAELMPLPCTPAFLPGIVNVRGRIVAVIDLKKFFDLEDWRLTDLHRIILVRGHGLELGLLADMIACVRSISVDSLQPSLPTLSGVGAAYLKGVTAERLVVLDLDRILVDPKIVVNDDVEI